MPPLRLTIVGGRPHAQIETGRVYGTEGVPVQPREWIHVAAVKRGEEFLLYLDGEQQASAQVPARITTAPGSLAGNPFFTGVTFTGRLQEARLWSRAPSPKEIRRLVGH